MKQYIKTYHKDYISVNPHNSSKTLIFLQSNKNLQPLVSIILYITFFWQLISANNYFILLMKLSHLTHLYIANFQVSYLHQSEQFSPTKRYHGNQETDQFCSQTSRCTCLSPTIWSLNKDRPINITQECMEIIY